MDMKVFHLYIKNMVCDRCIRVVQEEMERLGYTVLNVQLGKCNLAVPVEPDLERIRTALESNGFELLEDEASRWVNQVKTTIISLIQNGELEMLNQPLSQLLADRVGKDYTSLSRLFSAVEGITIEKYFILQKIERVKELWIYDELTLSEIAYQLGYSSVQHLSNQFKKVTGCSPREFKQLRTPHRVTLDRVQAAEHESK